MASQRRALEMSRENGEKQDSRHGIWESDDESMRSSIVDKIDPKKNKTTSKLEEKCIVTLMNAI